MGKKQCADRVIQNETIRVITFPLYIPVIIVIGLIIIFSNILKSEEIKISSTSETMLWGSKGEQLNVQENTGFENNILEDVKEYNKIQTNEKEITTVEQEKETDNLNIKKTESSEQITVDTKKENKKTTTKENDEMKTNNIYTTSNGEKYTIIGKLSIPSLNIKSNILSATSEALMKIALNKYWGANPNEVGNMVVVGHNYKGTKFFGKLPNIKIGDIVKITNSEGETLDYKVYDKYVIDPYDTKCTSQLTNGETEITLITCYNKGTQRLVVKARV